MALDLADKSPSGNTLTNVNTVADITTDSPFAASLHVAGFTASSSMILQNTAPASIFLTGDVTIESWVKPASLPASRMGIIDLGLEGDETEAGNILFRMSSNSSGKIEWFHENGLGVNNIALSTNVQLTIGTWTHIALGRDTTNKVIKIYINGSFVENVAYANQATGGTSARLHIGGTAVVSEYWDGKQDEGRIWNVLRSATQISNNYQLQLTGSETNLVGYFPFESVATTTSTSSTSSSSSTSSTSSSTSSTSSSTSSTSSSSSTSSTSSSTSSTSSSTSSTSSSTSSTSSSSSTSSTSSSTSSTSSSTSSTSSSSSTSSTSSSSSTSSTSSSSSTSSTSSSTSSTSSSTSSTSSSTSSTSSSSSTSSTSSSSSTSSTSSSSSTSSTSSSSSTSSTSSSTSSSSTSSTSVSFSTTTSTSTSTLMYEPSIDVVAQGQNVDIRVDLQLIDVNIFEEEIDMGEEF